MKRAFVIGITAVALGAGAMLQAQSPRSADVQMKAAQQKAEVEGDLKGAIEEYRESSPRPAATARSRRRRSCGWRSAIRSSATPKRGGSTNNWCVSSLINLYRAPSREHGSEARRRRRA